MRGFELIVSPEINSFSMLGSVSQASLVVPLICEEPRSYPKEEYLLYLAPVENYCTKESLEFLQGEGKDTVFSR